MMHNADRSGHDAGVIRSVKKLSAHLRTLPPPFKTKTNKHDTFKYCFLYEALVG